MNYDETVTLLKEIQIFTINKMADIEDFIYKQQRDLDDKQEDGKYIKRLINKKILEITDEINEFTNSKEPKCYQDEIDRLWAKRIVLEEILEEVDS